MRQRHEEEQDKEEEALEAQKEVAMGLAFPFVIVCVFGLKIEYLCCYIYVGIMSRKINKKCLKI